MSLLTTCSVAKMKSSSYPMTVPSPQQIWTRHTFKSLPSSDIFVTLATQNRQTLFFFRYEEN